ncbi:MAG TPA: hypothetical protein PL193_01035 [Xanthobacteraceae bacterium]|nr:hypothetical protein [Xanthobacteraceae bacterium]
MLEAIAGFAVSFLARLLLEWIGEQKKTAGEQEVGRLRSELDHALEALKRQRAIAEIAARIASREEVLARLEEGSA